MNNKTADNTFPLDRLEVDVSRLPQKGRLVKFHASEQELLALSKHFSLVAIDFLDSELLLKRWRRNGVVVRGVVSAKITQRCVVSLEPVDQEIEEDIDILFVEENSPFARPQIDTNGELVLDPEGNDLPEIFYNDIIRIDEVILEALALAIEPHPRLPGVEISAEFTSGIEDGERPESPFAVLDQLKDKKN